MHDAEKRRRVDVVLSGDGRTYYEPSSSFVADLNLDLVCAFLPSGADGSADHAIDFGEGHAGTAPANASDIQNSPYGDAMDMRLLATLSIARSGAITAAHRMLFDVPLQRQHYTKEEDGS
jgi:hypothetical protein